MTTVVIAKMDTQETIARLVSNIMLSRFTSGTIKICKLALPKEIANSSSINNYDSVLCNILIMFSFQSLQLPAPPIPVSMAAFVYQEMEITSGVIVKMVTQEAIVKLVSKIKMPEFTTSKTSKETRIATECERVTGSKTY